MRRSRHWPASSAKTGLTREQLVERADAKGNNILFAVIEKPGRPTPDVLAEAIPAIVPRLPLAQGDALGRGVGLHRESALGAAVAGHRRAVR